MYWDVVQKIMEEAFEHSQVMENASWLCNVLGPRDAKSPSYIAAAQWAKERLEEHGLSNAAFDKKSHEILGGCPFTRFTCAGLLDYNCNRAENGLEMLKHFMLERAVDPIS